MKKLLIILLALALLTAGTQAEAIPKGVLDYVASEQKYYLSAAMLWVEDYIEIASDDSMRGFALLRETSGWYKYVFFSPYEGDMVYHGENSRLMPPVNLEGYTVHLIKEESGAGFRLERRNAQDEVRQCIGIGYEGSTLGVTGWFDLDASRERAAVKDGIVSYYDIENGRLIGQAELAPSVWSVSTDFEALPKTAADAAKMERITRRYAENLYPGWTLRYYDLHGYGGSAETTYSRIENGFLTLRHSILVADEAPDYYDTMPVPLSSELLSRLETEAFETLINADGYSEAFKTDNTIDCEKLGVTGKILQSHMQKNALVLLTEENSFRHIWVVDQKENAYRARKSMRIDKEVSLDIFHSGDGGIQPVINGLQMGFGVDRHGDWTLQWVQGKEDYSVTRLGIRGYDADWQEVVLYGEMHSVDLFDIDFDIVPASFEEAKTWLHQDNIAVVNNPVSTDRLNLREEPRTSANSLGKFYNGTPVFVLERQGEWAHVQIGFSGISGWMMSKHLAFGADGNGIESAFEIMEPKQKTVTLYTDLRQKNPVCTIEKQRYNYHIVGVCGSDFYIILTDDGDAGYARKTEFWPGNG